MCANDIPSTGDLFKTTERVQAEYAAAVSWWDDADADAKEAAYQEVKRLQALYMQKSRRLRAMWNDDRMHYPGHRVIDANPVRCRAVVTGGRQCSRRATWLLGDLRVCTQHWRMIDDDGSSIMSCPDLIDIDGQEMAGHGVLEYFPQPWIWQQLG